VVYDHAQIGNIDEAFAQLKEPTVSNRKKGILGQQFSTGATEPPEEPEAPLLEGVRLLALDSHEDAQVCIFNLFLV